MESYRKCHAAALSRHNVTHEKKPMKSGSEEISQIQAKLLREIKAKREKSKTKVEKDDVATSSKIVEKSHGSVRVASREQRPKDSSSQVKAVSKVSETKWFSKESDSEQEDDNTSVAVKALIKIEKNHKDGDDTAAKTLKDAVEEKVTENEKNKSKSSDKKEKESQPSVKFPLIGKMPSLRKKSSSLKPNSGKQNTTSFSKGASPSTDSKTSKNSDILPSDQETVHKGSVMPNVQKLDSVEKRNEFNSLEKMSSEHHQPDRRTEQTPVKDNDIDQSTLASGTEGNKRIHSAGGSISDVNESEDLDIPEKGSANIAAEFVENTKTSKNNSASREESNQGQSNDKSPDGRQLIMARKERISVELDSKAGKKDVTTETDVPVEKSSKDDVSAATVEAITLLNIPLPGFTKNPMPDVTVPEPCEVSDAQDIVDIPLPSSSLNMKNLELERVNPFSHDTHIGRDVLNYGSMDSMLTVAMHDHVNNSTFKKTLASFPSFSRINTPPPPGTEEVEDEVRVKDTKHIYKDARATPPPPGTELSPPIVGIRRSYVDKINDVETNDTVDKMKKLAQSLDVLADKEEACENISACAQADSCHSEEIRLAEKEITEGNKITECETSSRTETVMENDVAQENNEITISNLYEKAAEDIKNVTEWGNQKGTNDGLLDKARDVENKDTVQKNHEMFESQSPNNVGETSKHGSSQANSGMTDSVQEIVKSGPVLENSRIIESELPENVGEILNTDVKQESTVMEGGLPYITGEMTENVLSLKDTPEQFMVIKEEDREVDSSSLKMFADVSKLEEENMEIDSSSLKMFADVSKLEEEDKEIDFSSLKMFADVSKLEEEDREIDSSSLKMLPDGSILEEEDKKFDSASLDVLPEINRLEEEDRKIDSSSLKMFADVSKWEEEEMKFDSPSLDMLSEINRLEEEDRKIDSSSLKTFPDVSKLEEEGMKFDSSSLDMLPDVNKLEEEEEEDRKIDSSSLKMFSDLSKLEEEEMKFDSSSLDMLPEVNKLEEEEEEDRKIDSSSLKTFPDVGKLEEEEMKFDSSSLDMFPEVNKLEEEDRKIDSSSLKMFSDVSKLEEEEDMKIDSCSLDMLPEINRLEEEDRKIDSSSLRMFPDVSKVEEENMKFDSSSLNMHPEITKLEEENREIDSSTLNMLPNISKGSCSKKTEAKQLDKKVKRCVVILHDILKGKDIKS